MPDLKSELQKFIANTAQEPATTTKPNRRAIVWNVLKKNAGVSAYELAAKTGESNSFVSTCLLSFVNRSLATRTYHNGVLYHTAVGENYPEFDKVEFARQLGLARKTRKVKKVIRVKAKPTEPAAPSVQVTDIDAMLSKLNVIQAKELMRKLNELFSA